jgi:hypothetical protein
MRRDDACRLRRPARERVAIPCSCVAWVRHMESELIASLNRVTDGVRLELVGSIAKSLTASLVYWKASLERVIAEFATTRAVLLQSFLPPDVATAVGTDILLSRRPVQEIRTSKVGASWSLQMLDDSLAPFAVNSGGDLFSAILLYEPVSELLCAIAGTTTQRLLTTKRWVNCYREGQFITPHVDTTGDFQAVLCLSAPPPNHGGEILMGVDRRITLVPGDLLLFAASSIEHSTLPVRASPSAPDPVRVTGVCRYYRLDGRRPDSKVALYDDGGNVVGYRYKE